MIPDNYILCCLADSFIVYRRQFFFYLYMGRESELPVMRVELKANICFGHYELCLAKAPLLPYNESRKLNIE